MLWTRSNTDGMEERTIWDSSLAGSLVDGVGRDWA